MTMPIAISVILPIGAFSGTAFVLACAEVSTLQQPDVPLRENSNCNI